MGTCEFVFSSASEGFSGRDSVQKLRSPHSISSAEALNEHYRAESEKSGKRGLKGGNSTQKLRSLRFIASFEASDESGCANGGSFGGGEVRAAQLLNAAPSERSVHSNLEATQPKDALCSLHTEDLTVGYEGVPLISNIKIELHRGEMLTLIGPNGAGKSTILKSIAKYLEPVGGTVYIDERSLHEMSPKDLSTKMSVVLTGRLSTELMTCRDVVETGRYPYTGRLGILSEEDHQVVDTSMALVNVTEIADKDFTQISDGQRQRVLLARAICQEPDIIVLDEPTSFLDVHYKLELLGLLRSLAKSKGIAVIMSLHELDLAQKISDTIMCVKGDRILRYGTPQDIFTRETIHELYSLDNGSYNPLFGSVELSPTEGEPHVFVLAGNGTGASTFRLLQRQNIPFATGVLFENDIDYALARDLSHNVISSPAFKPASARSLDQAKQLLAQTDAVICCTSQENPLNESNAQLLNYAHEQRKRIINAEVGLSTSDAESLVQIIQQQNAQLESL